MDGSGGTVADALPLPPTEPVAERHPFGEPAALVEVRGITKRFGAVVALADVALAIRPAEVLAVLGENGAGKTTLMNVLAGMTRPDAGAILVGGQEAEIGSPQAALRLGIGTVYQHFTLVPTLSVLENVVLGTAAGSPRASARVARRVAGLLGGFGLDVPLGTEVRHLAIGQRQRVEIAKVLFRAPGVLLLDEPTSVLTPLEVDGLLASLRRLRAEGVGVVLITHKLEEALRVSDRIVVLRQGRKAGEIGPAALAGDREAARNRIVALMFGGAPPRAASTKRADRTVAGPVVLALRGVSARGDRGETALDGCSLELRGGEVFGIAGVDGNGQKELGEVIAGQRPVAAGRVEVGGADVTNLGVAAAARAGVGYVTDDRLGEGCVAGASVADNLVLKAVGRPPFARGFLLDRRAIAAHARALVERFGIRAPGIGTPVRALSGGNVQKLLLARELAAEPRVLVCNKPTHGLDVRTAGSVLATLRAQAEAGRAVLLISSELDELLAVCDRVGVISGGRLVGTFGRDEADPATIGRLMLGGRAAA